MPLWLNERAWSGSTASESNIEFIATVPLVSFISSFVASLLIKNTQRFISHPLAYMLGSIVCVSSGVWVQFGASLEAANLNLFAIGILIGAGSSITMIASLCIIADMIGSHTDQGGFIYSTVTFCDKLITGLVVVAIESM
jgi:Na+/melibiose symporter-like transporter